MIPSTDNPLGYRFFEDGFPDGSEECPGCLFKTDFRIWLRYVHLADIKSLNEEQKFKFAIRLCYQRINAAVPVEKLISGISWFAGCGESDRVKLLEIPNKLKEDIEAEAEVQREQPSSFSYFWDFKEVWAAFRGRYGIDLYTAEHMHWWGFVGLMNNLFNEPALARLIELRTVKNKDNPSRKVLINSKLAALPVEDEE